MKRKTIITAVAVIVLGAAAATALLAFRASPEDAQARDALPPATEEVVKTTLVETKTVTGTLGYGDAVPVSTSSAGTLTWIAPEGATVKRGGALFKVDEQPVVVLYGALPLYRTLRDGVEGADVKQLERNLRELGYTGFTVDETFTSATAEAVWEWQEDLGVTATGTVEPGQVVNTAKAVRIAERTARVGDAAGGGAAGGGAGVLSYTGTTRQITVELEVADQALAVKGRRVSVRIPGGDTVTGVIADVGTVAAAPEESSGSPEADGSTDEASIEVTVEVADQKALGSLDAAPVDVDFTSDRRSDVLAVPVAALLALAEGGYGVQLVENGTTRIVAVETGMFAGDRVEVSGEGIVEGVRVGVPT